MTRRFRVTGRVQGVGFRAWTKDQADDLGLSGWVRNEADGAVTAVASGAPGQLAQLAAALEHGPPAATVRTVEIAEADAGDASPGTGFKIRA